jgi:hypothetical protein
MRSIRPPLAVLTAAFCAALPAAAQEEDPERRTMTQQEIEAWLDARNVPGAGDVEAVDEPPEVPPPPPRSQGLVVQGSVGALGHLGPMKNISPTAPWFHLLVGYEPLSFLMAFAEADVAFAGTSYANPPPEPRSYAFYGFGGGLRLTLHPTERVGIYAQGSLGLSTISEDVLHVYGFESADELNLYYGGVLGLEWYQVNPHYALALHGGVRNYDAGFARDTGGGVALAWIGGASIRYAF